MLAARAQFREAAKSLASISAADPAVELPFESVQLTEPAAEILTSRSPEGGIGVDDDGGGNEDCCLFTFDQILGVEIGDGSYKMDASGDAPNDGITPEEGALIQAPVARGPPEGVQDHEGAQDAQDPCGEDSQHESDVRTSREV